MTDSRNAHQFLRAATADCHARVDSAFGAFPLTTRDGYAAFLQAQARAFLAAEAALDKAGAASVIPDWADRKRGQALLADLRDLDVAAPSPLTAPALTAVPAIWGAVYVLEGSRLGGRFLLGNVPEGMPRAFLGQPQQKGAWRTLVEQLDDALIDDGDRGIAALAARTVFELFEAGARSGQTGRLGDGQHVSG